VRRGERRTRTGFLKSMSRKSALLVLGAALVVAIGLGWGVGDDGRTSQGWLTI
jgi:hypothetical protein